LVVDAVLPGQFGRPHDEVVAAMKVCAAALRTNDQTAG
jgi:hypothetical protein